MSKEKAQGTRHESWIVNALAEEGITARRLAEGGSSDEGDVEATIDGERWILEGKARQALNIQATLGKARRKAGGSRVAVVWKRLVRVPGKQVRQPVEGERIVVVVSWEDFVALVSQRPELDGTVDTDRKDIQ
jgi:hypothetical protein